MGYTFSALGAARDKDDLRILAAKLHRRVRVGIVFADGGERRLHFLHEVQPAPLGKAQPRRARDADGILARAELLLDDGELIEHAFLDLCEVPLVARI